MTRKRLKLQLYFHVFALFMFVATFTTSPVSHRASCDLIGRPGPEGKPGSKHGPRDQDPLPLPPASVGGVKDPPTWARDPSSLSMYPSGGGAEGSRGGGGECSGKYSPVPSGGGAGLSLHLNPTTLAMLQQHNFIPYFRGTRATTRSRTGGGPCCCKTQTSKLLKQPEVFRVETIWSLCQSCLVHSKELFKQNLQ